MEYSIIIIWVTLFISAIDAMFFRTSLRSIRVPKPIYEYLPKVSLVLGILILVFGSTELLLPSSIIAAYGAIVLISRLVSR